MKGHLQDTVMSPIRILHVVEAFGVGGGVENGVANLIERLDPDRFEHVLCGVFRFGPLIERYPAGQVHMVCLGQRKQRLSTQLVALAQVIRDLRPHVVHSRNWGALEAVIAGRWVGSCAVIHSEHGVEENQSTEPFRRKCFRRVAFGLADQVFAVSHQLKEMLAERTGFSLSKISVIHNGVNTTRFRPDIYARQRCRADLDATSTEFCIGCVGRLSKIKDYPTILRAVECLTESCPSWRLFIVGAGAELPALEEFVRSRPVLAGRVRFMGAMNHIPEFLAAMDTYVLPSMCEGISNALLEAMATALPVVVTDTGGNPEVVADGDSGVLFPVGDCRALANHLRTLYNNDRLREQLGERAFRRASEFFSLDSMVQKYDAMYMELAGVRQDGKPRPNGRLYRVDG
jgi:sugar transferase (PEP-CTERM/EpsH1 system associated)